MCQFVSALVLRDGNVLSHPMLDSHSDLVRYFKLPDMREHHQHFAKVELLPVDWLDVGTWEWRLDEACAPGWWDEVANTAERRLRERANRMILRTGEHDLIVDGCWIVGGNAAVRDVRGGRIRRVQDHATIRDVWGSATICGVGGSATIRNVGGSATICDVGGSATICGVGGSATICNVGGSAIIRGVLDSANIGAVGNKVTMDASAQARVMRT